LTNLKKDNILTSIFVLGTSHIIVEEASLVL